MRRIPLFPDRFDLYQFSAVRRVGRAVGATRASLPAPGRELPREGADDKGGRESNGYDDDQGLQIHGYKIMEEASDAKWSGGSYPYPRRSPPW